MWNMQQLRILITFLKGLVEYYISGVRAPTQTVSQVNFEAGLYPVLAFTLYLLVITEIRRMSFTCTL